MIKSNVIISIILQNVGVESELHFPEIEVDNTCCMFLRTSFKLLGWGTDESQQVGTALPRSAIIVAPNYTFKPI